MASESEVIAQQMRETRAALTDKLQTLERQVTGTIQDVSDTVENVRCAVHETVDTVQQSVRNGVAAIKSVVDIEQQVVRDPWLMLGGSIVLGCLGGYLLAKRPPSEKGLSDTARTHTDGQAERLPATAGAPDGHVESTEPSSGTEPAWITELAEKFRPEIEELRRLAIGTGLGLLRDMISQSAPEELSRKLAEVIDSVTVKLGGCPISAPIIEHSHCESDSPGPSLPPETAKT
jgi:ElaB/YqjD/DUF883 family membrane-anchored ribosome-binding protein